MSGDLLRAMIAFGLLPGHLGAKRLGRLVLRPAVVERLAPLNLETSGDVGRRAAPAPEVGWQNALGDRLRAVTRVRGEGSDQGLGHGDGPGENKS